jgi:hypothetical protein
MALRLLIFFTGLGGGGAGPARNRRESVDGDRGDGTGRDRNGGGGGFAAMRRCGDSVSSSGNPSAGGVAYYSDVRGGVG